jgi:hypothetical protein
LPPSPAFSSMVVSSINIVTGRIYVFVEVVGVVVVDDDGVVFEDAVLLSEVAAFLYESER